MAPARPAPAAAYRAFISYSHADDRPLAVALQRALQRLGRAWYRPPSFRVFRDETSLTASPQLWGSIVRALEDSDFFLILASPSAAASKWVDREVEWWLAHKAPDHILMALADGEIHWDDAAADFDPSATTAVPPRLFGASSSEPFWIDLRELRDASRLSLLNPTFLDRVATIAATLHGRAKEDLVGEDLRQQRRWARLRTSALAVLAVLTTLAVAASVLFFLQRNDARRQTALAEAREFTARANQAINPYEAIALALEAEMRTAAPISEARAAYAAAVQRAAELPARPTSPLMSGHTNQVHAVAWSPDGRRLSSAGPDGTVRLWDTATSRPVGQPLRGHADSRPSSLAWSPDGKRIVSADDEPVLVVWDAASGKPAGPQIGQHTRKPGAAITSMPAVDWSPDGRTLASAFQEEIRFWDARTGRPVGPALRGHSDLVTSVAWSPDGSRLASGSADDTVRVWDVVSGRPVGKAFRGNTSVLRSSVSWSADSTRIASSGIDGVRIWNLRTQALDRMISSDEAIEQVAWSPRGAYLASAGGGLRIWDSATGRQVGDTVVDYEAISFTSRFMSVAWSPDGTRLATGNSDNTIRLWDLNASSPSSIASFPTKAEDAVDVAWSPDGTRLATAASGGIVRFWEPAGGREAGEPIATGEFPAPVIAWSPDGTRLATSADDDVVVWDAATRRALVRLTGHAAQVLAVAWSPNGKWLASASRDGEVWLWDVRLGIPIGAPLAGHKQGANAVAWSPDGARLATADVTGVLRLWSFTDTRLITTVPPQGSTINSIAWSPDGTRLALAALSGLRVDRVDTTVRTIAYVPGAGLLGRVAWSPDGSLLAAAGQAGPVQLFDPDGSRVGYLARGEADTFGVAFSPDGRRLAAGLADGTLRIWAAVDERQACRVAREAISPNVLRGLLGPRRPTPMCGRASLDVALPPIPTVPDGHVFAARRP